MELCLAVFQQSVTTTLPYASFTESKHPSFTHTELLKEREEAFLSSTQLGSDFDNLD